tara:strand:- start:490 stop:666 length:177 start_codon:yes stop_codon:yes gene_type:complete
MSKICDDNFDDEIMDLSEVFREVMEDLRISRISGVPIYMLRYEPIDMMSSDDSEEEDE